MIWKRAMRWAVNSAAMLGLATGCMFDAGRTNHEQTSLVSYLYPGDSAKAMTPTIPTLTLPLKVGLAWVPGNNSKERYFEDSTLPEEFLQSTLAQVRRHAVMLALLGPVALMVGVRWWLQFRLDRLPDSLPPALSQAGDPAGLLRTVAQATLMIGMSVWNSKWRARSRRVSR